MVYFDPSVVVPKTIFAWLKLRKPSGLIVFDLLIEQRVLVICEVHLVTSWSLYKPKGCCYSNDRKSENKPYY